MEVEIKSKDEKYRGQDVSMLKKMTIREVAQFLPSRSRRTVMKHFDKLERFVKECDLKQMRNKRIRTHFRDAVVVPQMVGKIIAIHNGKMFQDVEITGEMIGHRLGEFALTRKRVAHSAAGIGATKSSRALKK